MKYFLSVDKSSKDKRVAELIKLFEKDGTEVRCYKERENKEAAEEHNKDAKPVYFIAPRTSELPEFPEDCLVFGYSKTLGNLDSKNYVCLSDDEDFIRANNYLTALAQKELLLMRFGRADQKILIIGYGKLTEQLEKVLTEADISILNFNHHKAADIKQKYGTKAYFETAPLEDFPVIINTIPRPIVKISKPIKSVIYELASPPYGFDFGKIEIKRSDGSKRDKKRIDYNIEPGLPGRFYPSQAAEAVYNCIKRIINGIDGAENQAQDSPPEEKSKEKAKETIVLCLTASPCSYGKLSPVLSGLCEKYTVIPVMSVNACNQNRFLDIEEFKNYIRELTGNNIITTIAGSETLSSRKEIVASAVVPATGNTIAKLANAVTDTPVTMAVKALLRNSKPCVIGISTNDALSGSAVNIGLLLNRKHYYFVPFSQDNPQNKPYSMVCDFSKTVETIEAALEGKQIQPIILGTDKNYT